MEIYERIIELRKKHLPKKYNQTEFGEKLGVSRSVIKNIELGVVETKGHMIKLICQTFNVNENWLRNGIEPIFIEKDKDTLQEVFEQYGLSEFAISIIKSYIELEKSEQKIFEKFVLSVFKEMQEKTPEEYTLTFEELVDDEVDKSKKVSREKKEKEEAS